ncbi:MAG: hypothetical protein GY909_15375 [Oligoflexia bacterium]|nr:hypothetical protein [Oligoflexia bacterium]
MIKLQTLKKTFVTPLPTQSKAIEFLKARAPISPIKNEKEHKTALEFLDKIYTVIMPELTDDSEKEQVRSIIDFITGLVEKYEDDLMAKELGINDERLSPPEIIKLLMQNNDLKNKDLVDVFGAPANVSAFLTGKRPLGAKHAKLLAQKFGIEVGSLIQ